MKIKQALILAGGFGKRLGIKSKSCPKPMQLINNEPFLNYIIWNLKRHNIKDIILSIGYLSENFKAYYEDGSKHGINIKYVKEIDPKGTAGAIKACENFLEDYFLLINGDTIYDINYHDLSLNFLDGTIGNIALNYVENVSRYGEVKTEDLRIISFKEKLGNNGGYINSGVCVLSKKITEHITSSPSSLEKDVFPNLIKNNLLTARKYKSFFLDIGLPETLNEAQTLLPKWKKKSALLLDRDGVINHDYGYVHSMDNFRLIENALETIKLANDLGILVIVITNQSGIGRGFYSEEQFKFFTSQINSELIDYGAHIDATYFCPHHPTEGKGDFKKNCNCRKPKTGMIEKALSDWNLDKKRCFLIGDKDSDTIAAKNCDIKYHLYSYKKENLLEIFKKNLINLRN